MRFVNWYPDPRFVHLADWTFHNSAGYRWTSQRGVDVRCTSAGLAYFQSQSFTAPAGQTLNLVANVQVENGEPDMRWGYLLMLYDDTAGASVSNLAPITAVSDSPQAIRFTVPSSGRMRLQGVCPSSSGGQLKISNLSVVSDDGLAWMREHHEWWIHGQLMPLRS